jgi:ribose transport system permease protein
LPADNTVLVDGLRKTNTIKRLMGLSEFSVFIALVAMFIIMCFASPYFLRMNNIMNVLIQISRYGIITAGMALIMISGGIDLSVGYAVGFCACIFAWFSLHTALPWFVVGIITLGVGAGIGFFNGLLVTRVGLVPFIVTLASMKILGGGMLLITGGMPITFKSGLSWLGYGRFGPVPIPVILMFLVIFLGSVFAKYTQAGRGLYAVGNNERAAILSGISSKNLKCLSYVITSTLCAIVGIIVAGNLGTADQAMGIGYEMDVIAAVVIGGVAMSGGEGHVWGALIGASIMGILRNAFILLGISSYWQSIVIGAVILAAMTVDIVRGKKRE